MALTGKQSDVFSLMRQHGASSATLGDNNMRIIGLACDRGVVSLDKETGVFTPLVTTEQLQAIEEFSDMTIEDVIYMLNIMLGTYTSAMTATFPDGRSAADVIRKWAGNAVVK
jgi:hypothetical protein